MPALHPSFDAAVNIVAVRELRRARVAPSIVEDLLLNPAKGSQRKTMS
jgi:hypothetical protein